MPPAAVGREGSHEENFVAVLPDVRHGAFSLPLQFVCSDMWKAYLKVIAKKAGQAVHVLDRFHVMAKMNKAIDKVRCGRGEASEGDGYEPVLKHSRWCLLKREENLTEKQAVKLSELLSTTCSRFGAA